MAKLTLSDLANITGNEQSAINTINNNSTLVETALENTLSRDGTSPNSMSADLDMNGYDIINVENVFINGDIIEADVVADYLDFNEASVPSSPSANTARVYAVDDGSGVTKIDFKNSAGAVIPFTHTKVSNTGGVTRTFANKATDVFSVRDFGADSTGVADSSAAIQAAIDAAAALTSTRGTVYIPSGEGGTYTINSALTWKPDVNIVCDPGVRIVAGATMNAMLQTGVGSSAVRLRNVWLQGGRWDGNYLARRGFWIRDGEKVQLHDFTMRSIGTFVDGSTETESSYIRIGDPTQSSSCYEVMVDGFNCYRTDNAASPTQAPANNYGIYSSDGASDCHITNGVISGIKYGIADEMAHWKISFVHVWNFQSTQGALVNGFYDTIGGVIYAGCQVDCATYEVPFRFTGTNHPNQMVACQVNCSLDTASSTDNVGSAVQVDAGVQLAAIGNTITCNASKRFAADYTINATAILQVDGNQTKNVVTPVGNGVTTPDGRIVAGFSVPVAALGGLPKIQALGTDLNASMLAARYSANASPPRYTLAKSRNATVGSHTIVQSGDSLGEILAQGSSGTAFADCAAISFEVDGTPGAAGDMPGRIILKTSPDGAATVANAFQVDSTGKAASIHPTGGLGYGVGAGGSVTQATNKATGVTLNKPCGQITLNNASLATVTNVAFTFTNSCIAATDILHLQIVSGETTAHSYFLNAKCAAGSAQVNLFNRTAGSLGEALVISYAVIKSVIT